MKRSNSNLNRNSNILTNKVSKDLGYGSESVSNFDSKNKKIVSNTSLNSKTNKNIGKNNYATHQKANINTNNINFIEITSLNNIDKSPKYSNIKKNISKTNKISEKSNSKIQLTSNLNNFNKNNLVINSNSNPMKNVGKPQFNQKQISGSSHGVKVFGKPSEKYTKIKASDPFAGGKKHKTNFGYVYSAGGIPCRIQHGGINMKLKWDIEPENLDYDPILLVCFEGLLESEHPYNFASRQCIREMLTPQGAYEKVLPILPKLINPLRLAFSSNNSEIFQETLDITQILSDLVKENLNPYLHFFLQQINKRSFELKFKEKVFDVLRVLETNGGDDALKEIKKKIPTYVSTI